MTLLPYLLAATLTALVLALLLGIHAERTARGRWRCGICGARFASSERLCDHLLDTDHTRRLR